MDAIQVMCVFLMLWGVVLFGNLLADLAEINRATKMGEMEKLEKVQLAVGHVLIFVEACASSSARGQHHAHF